MYAWLKLFHVLCVMLLSVGVVGALVVAVRARRSQNARDILTLMRAHHAMVTVGVIPGAIGSLISGGGLVAMLGSRWTDLWLVGTLLGWVLSLVIGVGLLVPADASAAREGQRLVDAGIVEPSEDLRRFIGAPKVYLAEWSTVLLLVIMAYFMVLKPL